MSKFEEVLKFICTNVTDDLTSVRDALLLVATSDPTPIEEEHLFKKIVERSGLKIRTLRSEYNQIRIAKNIPQTDLGVAIATEVLETKYEKGLHLINCRGLGFFTYNSTHWVPLPDPDLRKQVQPIVAKHKGLMGNKSVASRVQEVLTCISDLIEIYDTDESPSNVINTTSGEIWLDKEGNHELKAHSPGSRLFNCLPYPFDPGATSPVYDKTVREIFEAAVEPEDVIRHWHEFLGYLTQPDRFAEAVWFLIGSGSNGKSTLLRMMLGLLGPGSVLSCDLNNFENDHFKYRMLFGKLLVVDEDFKKEFRVNEAFFKKISGAGQLSGRTPHKFDVKAFKNTAAPVLVGNHFPRCDDLSNGWKRRLNVFLFEKQFSKSEADPERSLRILEEMSGILNHALSGYSRLCMRDKKFDPPKYCLSAAEQFLERSNPFFAYAQDRLEPVKGKHVRLNQIRKDMLYWAENVGITLPRVGNDLKAELQNLGFEIGKMDGYHAVKEHQFCSYK